MFNIMLTPEQLAQKYVEAQERHRQHGTYVFNSWISMPFEERAILIAIFAELLEEIKKHVCPMTVDEALEECRKWRLTQQELDDLLH